MTQNEAAAEVVWALNVYAEQGDEQAHAILDRFANDAWELFHRYHQHSSPAFEGTCCRALVACEKLLPRG